MENKLGYRTTRTSHLVSLFVIPLVILLLAESIQRDSILATLQWIVEHSLMFLVNYFLLQSAYLFLYMLPRIVYIIAAPLLSLGCFLFSYIHHMKLSLRGEPLLPSDLYLVSEAKGISGAISADVSSILLLAASSIVVIFLIIRFYPKYVWKTRIMLGICSVLMIGLLTSKDLYAFRDRMGIKLFPWNQVENVRANGFSYSFVNNFLDLHVEEPFTYNRDEIQAIVNKTAPSKKPGKAVKPNVIVIMSEAMFDPTVLPNVTFERDPMPTIHQLAKTHSVGTAGVSVFGGGTANSEFEALTGLAIEKLPVGAIAYSQYAYRPIDALPSIMKKNGYHTTAIHSFYHWYYNRTQVYKNFGFDRFIPMEFMTSPETKGPFIKDSEVAKRILEETKKTAGQDFVFAVTMQSHGPYDDQNIPIENHVSGSLSENGKRILETYVNHIEDADKLLKTLIDEYKKRNEPTVVVMYGDHLPLLGSDYQVYKETSYITDIYKQSDSRKMHLTPLVIWNNIGLPKEDINMQLPFLGAYLVDRIGLEGNTTTSLLMQAYEKNIRYLSEKFNGFFPQYGAGKDRDWKKSYDLLWYDILFGNQYAYSLSHQPSVNPDYVLGSGPIVLDFATPSVILKDQPSTDANEEQIITIKGKNFEGSSHVSINDTLVPTTYVDHEHLRINLPASFLEEEELKVEIKVLNEQENQIATSSNQLTIPVRSKEEPALSGSSIPEN